VDIVPTCHEYTTLYAEKTPLFYELQELRTVCPVARDAVACCRITANGLQSVIEWELDFQRVRRTIEEDNANSHVPATSDQLAAVQRDAAVAAKPNGTPPQPLQNGAKRVPEIRAKPGHLSSTSLVTKSEAGRKSLDAGAELQARFSRLRGGSGVSVKDLPPSLVPGGGRPQGPRSMPNKALQIDVKNALPQVPPPVYSPSASYGSPRGLSPPRSTRAVQPDAAKQKLPSDSEIQMTADVLYGYVKASSGVAVLLLDVRPREEYDLGHIYSRSIVCIDPIILRKE